MNTYNINAYAVILLGITLSIIAAYFSISGLTKIFINNNIPIITMGIGLEIAKLTTVNWIYIKWNVYNIAMKLYFIIAIIGIMIITSLGIFGFLSHAAQDTNTNINKSNITNNMYQSQIQSRNNIINNANIALKQLDNTVDKLIQYDRIRGNDGAVQTRENQKQERNQLNNIINNANNDINDIVDKQYNTNIIKQSDYYEVGSLIAIANIFGNSNYNNILNMLIFLVILVFDPLALLLTLSGTIAILSRGELYKSTFNDSTKSNDSTNEILSPNKLKRWKSLDNGGSTNNNNIPENRRGV